jgi:aldehyde dehydrogenase (NAD+)
MSTVQEQQLPVLDAAPGVVARLRETFNSGRTRPLAFRLQQLDGLARFLREREHDIQDALRQDLGRPPLEAFTGDIAHPASDLAFVRKHLASWIRPERVRTPLVVQPGKSYIQREPLGVVLIIGPWNYPVQLVLVPLIGALAAGNCAVIKPSEVAPATSALLAETLPRYVDPDCVRIVEGGVPETTALLAERFDYIFYTGNGTVGRIVMQAAAKHLTPVTLELGGKSPCIVDRSTDLDVAARRIVWGKYYNAGQTCIAPDYILAHEAIEDDLLARLKQTVREFYGDDPRTSPDYGRVVNARHHRRLMALLPGSGELVTGGEADEADRYLAPTILRNLAPDAPVMADEIFGPILPVLRVKNVEEAVAFVNARPKPLALYLFTSDGEVQRRILERTSSGGALVNHISLHVGVPSLPFGGVGPSGMGAYHGRASFETFSHRKAVLVKPTWLDPRLVYPPYTETKKKWIKRLL